MTGTTTNPALDALGDRLERAAGAAIASGGTAPSGHNWGKLALIPALAVFVVAGMAIALLVPGGGGSTAEATVISAARETSGRATGRFEVTVTVDGPFESGNGVSLVTTGAYDADQGLFEAELDTSSVLAGITGGQTLGEVAPTIDAVIAGNDVYLDVSPLASVLGAEWLKVTLPEVVATEEGGVPSLIDPSAFLDALEGAGADMQEAGREDVRGVSATHYTGSLDLREAYTAIPDDERGSLEGSLGALLDEVDLPDVPVEVWVDDDGLVRRVKLSVDASGFGVPGLDGGGASLTAEFFDIGEDVAISVPPEDQVTTFDQLVPEGLFEDLGDVLEGLGEFDWGGLDDFLDDDEDPGLPPVPGAEESTTPTTI